MTNAWYQFQTMDNFNTWHETTKAAFGFPIQNIDADKNPVEGSFTTDIAIAVELGNNDVRAEVNNQYAEGLTICEAPPQPKPF